MSDQSIHKKGLAPGWWVAIAVAAITTAGGITEAFIHGYFGTKTAMEVKQTEAKQTITFVGRVSDDANSPIAGATVLATQDQNLGQGIHTDSNGQFQIELPTETKVLSLNVSADGFVSETVEANIHRTGAEPINLHRLPIP